MVEVNLLPWRHLQIRYERRVVLQIWISVIAISLIVSAYTHVKLSVRLATLQARITHLQEQNQLSINKKKQDVGAKQQQQLDLRPWLQKLRAYQQATLELMLKLKQPHAPILCFAEITRVNDTIQFSGMTRSAFDLTDFLMQWAAAPIFSRIRLNALEKQQSQLMQFNFTATENNYPELIGAIKEDARTLDDDHDL